MAQLVKSLPAVWESQVRSLGQEDPLEKEMATHSSILFQYSCLENPIDGGAWQATVHGVSESDRLSDFTFFLLYMHRISEPVHQRVQFPNRHISCVPQLH